MYDINIRMVYAFRAIGKYQTGAATVCGLLNLPSPPTTWATYEKALAIEVEAIAKESMKSAVEEAVLENNGSRDIGVALDGSWQKR